MTWIKVIDIVFCALLLRFLMGWLLANRQVARPGTLFSMIDKLPQVKFFWRSGILDDDVFHHPMFSTPLRLRASHTAFHPDGDIIPVATENSAILSYIRISPDNTERMLIVQNVSPAPQNVEIRLDEKIARAMTTCRDVVSGESLPIDRQNVSLTLKPFAIRWVDVS